MYQYKGNSEVRTESSSYEVGERIVVITKNGKLHVKKSVPGRFLPMKNGPILVHAVRTFCTFSSSVRVVLILPIDRRTC